MDEIHKSNSGNNSQNLKKRKVDTLPLVSSNESDISDEENSINKIKQVERCKVNVLGKNGYERCGKEVNLNTAKSTDTDNNSVMIDFESSTTAFDDDIIYEDADEEIDQINNGTRQIRINTPQN
ncbi:33586_t:CDS:2, partial [Racocetra persica]